MKKTIRGLCVLLLTLGLGRMEAQTSLLQDIAVMNFHHEPTDLTAKRYAVIDNNGVAGAVIKLMVRDTTFIVEPNLGLLRRESKVGEICLWVPVGTKRLTIRRYGLFPLDYIIPKRIESKEVYYAHMVGRENSVVKPAKENTNEKTAPVTKPQVTQKPPKSEKTIATLKQQPVKKKVNTMKKYQTRFFLGVGYQFTSDPGLTFSLGLNANHHIVEAGATMATSKTDSIYYYKNYTWLAIYSYQLMNVFFRYGYEIRTKGNVAFTCTPSFGIQSALSFGSGMYNERIGLHTMKAYKNGVAVSAPVGLRLALCLGKHFEWYVRPEYNFAVYKSDGYKLMTNGHDTFKKWVEGFSAGTGIVVTF